MANTRYVVKSEEVVLVGNVIIPPSLLVLTLFNHHRLCVLVPLYIISKIRSGRDKTEQVTWW